MSGPVRPPLAVEESDGSVVVRPANTIKFNAADFTVAKSGAEATISIDSTGTGASLTDKYVGFGDSSNLMTGSADLQWDDTAKELTIVGDSDNDAVVLIKGGETAAGEGPKLEIRNTSGTDSFVKLYTDNYNVTYMDGGTPGGTTRNIWKSGQLSGDTFVTTFNNDALPADFQIKGDNVDNVFYVDGGQDNVGIGTTPTSGYAGVVPRLHIEQPTDGIGVLIESDEDDADVGPQIVYYRNSDNPAADDILGRLRWEGKDSGGNIHMYGRQTNQIISPTDGQESGRMIWESRSLGTLYECMRFEGNDITFNYAASSAVDLLIKGDNKNILFADASQDNLGIGTSAPSAGVERMHVKGLGQAAPMVLIESTDDPGTSSSNPVLQLYNSSTPGMNLKGGELRFSAKNDAGSEFVYGSIGMTIRDSSANEDGSLEIRVAQNGAENTVEYMRIGTATQRVFINPGEGNIDTQISSENLTQAIFVNAGNDNVGIGTDPDSGIERLHVKGTDASKDLVMFESTDTDGNDAGPDLVLYRSKDSPGDAVQLGAMYFRGRNNTPADVDYARIEAEVESGFAGSENGTLRIGTVSDGTMYDSIKIDGTASRPVTSIYGRMIVAYDGANNSRITFDDPTGATDSYIEESGYDLKFNGNQRLQFNAPDKAMFTTDLTIYTADHSTVNVHLGNDATDSATFNYDSTATYDFKVNSDTLTAIMVDSSQDNVGVGAAPTSGAAQLQVDADCTHYYHVDALYTANHDVTVQQAHGCVLQMKTGSGTGVFNLPAAEAGMNLICVNTGAGMNFTVDTGDTLNGTTDGQLSSAITTAAAGVRLICIATNTWVAYPLNPLATI